MTTMIDCLEEHGVPYRTTGEHHHTSSGFLQLDCPSCSPSSGAFRLGYNLAGRFFTCWSCGVLPLLETLQQVLGVDETQSRRIAYSLPREKLLHHEHTGKLVVPAGVGPLEAGHRVYLRQRGFLPSQIVSKWDVGGISQLGGKLKWRLYIPIHFRGEVVSWTTRSIATNPSKRYWSASDAESAIPISSLLYGEDHCRNSVIVCEGPTDVWRIGYGSVALLGQYVSPARLSRLSRFSQRVLLFDSEPESMARAKRLANDLSVFDGTTTTVRLETGKDAASTEQGEIDSLKERFLGWE